MAARAKVPEKVDDRPKAIQLIMYLATQTDYVSVHDIHKDPLSGFPDHEAIKAALRAACDVLDVSSEKGAVSLYRLPRTFDGYREVFAMLKGSEDIYNFLLSGYSHAMVNELFIRDALLRWGQTPYFESLAAKYPAGQMNPAEAMVAMLAQQPGFAALAAMFSVSPAVADMILYPENLSRYELTHPKIALDLTFACDMVKRAPPGTVLSVKYEVIAQGMINIQMSGGTGIP
ncbi:MAG: hypothetical protein A4E28_02803 [Methanocella sp. PtaU1.Bin125]|nr:MAG: hypothetical protein A4E28_02803 [Methanocella sp. PtaU1.Bin125]